MCLECQTSDASDRSSSSSSSSVLAADINFCYSFESRLLTFKYWKGNINAADLATAGFFYTGCEDICKCVYCGVEIYRWEKGDCAITEHIKCAHHCNFANILLKCKNFSSEQSLQRQAKLTTTTSLFGVLFFLTTLAIYFNYQTTIN